MSKTTFYPWMGRLLLGSLLLLVAAAQGAAEQLGRSPYRIGVGDSLEVVVWKNADVSRRVWVRPDGRVTLPLVGEVAAEGLTPEELAGAITGKLKEYLTDPIVTISLETINGMAAARADGAGSAILAKPYPDHPPAETVPAPPQGPPPYRIGVEDVLEINVWRNPDVTRQVWVRPDGRIALPLIGETVAQGLTPGELAAEVETRLKRYLADTVVNVSVLETNSHTVYVMGMVRTPGALRLRSPRTLLQILTMAGGLQDFADSRNMAIVRWEAGKQKRIPVDGKKMMTKEAELDFFLQPGDVVIVP
ncbi:MAG: polysaccharide biosynthesis/export family protein [Deltaproteobacteria bacterium]|nr:polysaccharide biosynthesis/export family protein [Deltaproteobacteria bacterium]